ncbi:uncharacterized protein LOC122376424 [Amphibalanus amphitrite]|uniref:uncharacterized protein LOC122376424 n=1 Tax=Amphibalanus amphitrite TaxID=1232801 RepID=UPI001C8FE555|nr:uncharacterized protein LOC122376424 [Amphibalanus amphitrite]
MARTLNRAVRVLRWIAPGAALCSVALVTVSMTTPEWLITNERFPNGTGPAINKKTYSGLWKICYTPLGSSEFVCELIDYFPRENYSPDDADSTMAIPNAVVTTGPFLFAGAAVLLTGVICYAVGHCFRRRRLLSFVGGVNFILAGLLAMIATIVYISTFKAEVKNKLRSRNLWDPPRFTYRFGYGFYSLIGGFIMSELTGIVVIFLYIFWHQRDWERKSLKLAQQGCLMNGCAPRLRRDAPTSRSLDRGPPVPPAARCKYNELPYRQFASLPRRLDFNGSGECSMAGSASMDWVARSREGESEQWPRREVEEWPRMGRERGCSRERSGEEWGKSVTWEGERPQRRSADVGKWGNGFGPESWPPPRPGSEIPEWPPVSRGDSLTRQGSTAHPGPAGQRWAPPRHPPPGVYSLRVGEGPLQPRPAHGGPCSCHRPPPFVRPPSCRHVCRHQRPLPPTCVRCSASLCRQPALVGGWPGAPRPRMPAPHPPSYSQVTQI